ncbi:MAG: glycosyltransferase family 2 protein, partial [Bacteroidota bacterium]
MKQNVAVVILNWNGRKHLETFLTNVVEHSHQDATVYVVDNGSTDDSMQVAEAIQDVQCIYLPENFGFSKGYNQGLSQIEADVYVLLNSDVEVTPNWIPPVLKYMQESNVQACQPKVLSYHQKDQFEYAGATGGYIDKDGFVFCAGRIFDHHEKDQGQYNQNKQVFWASGASLFIKKENYDQCAGLDEDFFAHMEEIDLCWRLKNRGFAVGSCYESVVYHVGGGTLNKVN